MYSPCNLSNFLFQSYKYIHANSEDGCWESQSYTDELTVGIKWIKIANQRAWTGWIARNNA